MLRDRLVCGIRDLHVQRRLLAEPELSYKMAFDLAQAAEMATQSARELQAATPVSVHAMQKTGYARRQDTGPWQAKEPLKCYRCGATQHPSRDCPFKEAECHFCYIKGHLEKVCFAKNGQPPPTRNGRRPQTWKPRRRVQVCHAEDDAP